MSDFANFRPKSMEVLAGDKTLVVKEFVAAKRDAVVKVFLSGLDIANLLKPFGDLIKEYREKGTDGILDLDLSSIGVQLKGLILNILANELTEIGCLTLDVLENRQRVEPAKPLDGMKTNEKHGYEYSSEMFSWIKDNLTLHQEQQLIKAIIEVNDIMGLIKNYLALVQVTIVEKDKGKEKEIKEQK